MHCLTLYWGPLPLDTVERRSREALAEAERSGVSSLAATAYRVLARVAAHRGELDEARRFVEAATAITREEGSLLPRAVDCISRAMVEHARRRPGRRRGGPAQAATGSSRRWAAPGPG